jgi:hypothetical protein
MKSYFFLLKNTGKYLTLMRIIFHTYLGTLYNTCKCNIFGKLQSLGDLISLTI